jgi:hypothetical protein
MHDEMPEDEFELLLRKINGALKTHRKNPQAVATLPELHYLFQYMQRLLKNLARKYRKLQRFFDGGGLASEDFNDDVKAMRAKVRTIMNVMRRVGIPNDPACFPDQAPCPPGPGPAAKSDSLAPTKAEIGEFRVVQEETDGTTCLVVNGVPLRLPPSLAKVMKLLHESPTDGWSCGKLAATLGIRVPALRERISRLRETLREQGSNPDYIVTSGRGDNAQVRLALRHVFRDSGDQNACVPL